AEVKNLTRLSVEKRRIAELQASILRHPDDFQLAAQPFQRMEGAGDARLDAEAFEPHDARICLRGGLFPESVGELGEGAAPRVDSFADLSWRAEHADEQLAGRLNGRFPTKAQRIGLIGRDRGPGERVEHAIRL